MTIALTEENKFNSKTDKAKIAKIYTIGFGCYDEQAQVRGMEGHGSRVVSLEKINKLYEDFRGYADQVFPEMDGIEVYTTYILGDGFGFKEHYVNFKLEIRQNLRSTWDLNIEPMVSDVVTQMCSKSQFKYLCTNFVDRTEELIDEALEPITGYVED